MPAGAQVASNKLYTRMKTVKGKHSFVAAGYNNSERAILWLNSTN